MSCVNPLEGWLAAKLTAAGKRPVTFSRHEAFTDKPVSLPCGKCIGCIKDWSTAWSVRCFHESEQHEQNCFATLTYRDPAPDRLVPKDLRDFFKRLRSAGVKFRYFAVGEYGGRTRRPHYHVLFFGQDFLGRSVPLGMGEGSENGLYMNPWLTRMWKLGHVTIGRCEADSIFYTCGYSLKNVDQEDCFHVASRKPFVGAGWLEKYSDDIRRNGFVTIGGVKRMVPRSYLARPERQEEFADVRAARKAHVQSMTALEQWERRRSWRPKEANLIAASAASRDFSVESFSSSGLPTVRVLRPRR